MSRSSFYDSEEYRLKQSERAKLHQDKGTYEHLKKRIIRTCMREGCEVTFSVKLSDPKVYCGRGCAAVVSNSRRTIPSEIRKKISDSLKGNTNTLGLTRFKPSSARCENAACAKTFTFKRYETRRFCSPACAIKTIGSQITSPRASRGKAGVRTDIDPELYFYSRWEANMARLYTYLGIRWIFQPASFDIGNQIYTPDFYLPDTDMYIEVKNFWNEYSKNRDAKFRKAHPSIRLSVLLKDTYEELEREYASHIPGWEYKNTPFV